MGSYYIFLCQKEPGEEVDVASVQIWLKPYVTIDDTLKYWLTLSDAKLLGELIAKPATEVELNWVRKHRIKVWHAYNEASRISDQFDEVVQQLRTRRDIQ